MSKFGIKGEYQSILEIEKKDKNPFLIDLKVTDKVTIKRFKQDEAVKTDKITSYDRIRELTNQNKDLGKEDLTIAKMKKKQSSPFIFLYTDTRINYKRLSGTSLKVILYIIYEKLTFGVDYIIMNPDDLVTNVEISKSSSYNSIIELTNHKIIDKREDCIWWINPNYFYTGNRLLITTK